MLAVNNDIESLDFTLEHEPLKNVGVDPWEAFFHHNFSQTSFRGTSCPKKLVELAFIFAIFYKFKKIRFKPREMDVEIGPQALISPENIYWPTILIDQIQVDKIPYQKLVNGSFVGFGVLKAIADVDKVFYNL